MRVLQETRQRIMEGGYNDEISAGTIEGELVRVLDERLKGKPGVTSGKS